MWVDVQLENVDRCLANIGQRLEAINV